MATGLAYTSNYTPQTKRQTYRLLQAQLENERSSFISHWTDLGKFVLPRRTRFFVGDANRGDRRNQDIVDSTATLAARTLRSGMMAGVTSPARQWFRLTTPNPAVAALSRIKEWLHEVTLRMSTVFLRSNLYNSLPVIYGDVGVFGTACMFIEEDLDDVIRTYTFPIGSFMIANDERMKINVFIREFQMTVRQLVGKFGKRDRKTGEIDWDNFSVTVRNLWENKQRETWISVRHVIAPNEDYDESKQDLDSKYKKYSSCYYEEGYAGTTSGASYLTQGVDDDRFLSEKGYDYFPVLAPRWEVTGEDVYGTDCPGMTALGDTKQLQKMERRAMQAIDKMVSPPVTGPAGLKHQPWSTLPGEGTFTDVREGQQGFRPVYEVDPRIAELEGKEQEARYRIRRAYFEDLFLMLAQSDRRQITAREVEERHEEKLLALGPVLERLNQDLLDPLIDITFQIMERQSRALWGTENAHLALIPEPPEEIQGMDLKVEYISVMAQAQKAVGVVGLERFTDFVMVVAKMDPLVVDKIDTDKLVEAYADVHGVQPDILTSEEEVEQIRAGRAAANKAQADLAAMEQMSKSANALAGAKTNEKNALTDVMSALPQVAQGVGV